MAKRMTKNDKLEPAVRISRKCFVCDQVFALSHPNDPKLMCDSCQAILCEMIRKYKNEQQEIGNGI